MSHFLSRVKAVTQSPLDTCRSWPTFLDPAFLSIPYSTSDATTRVAQNLTHFRSNYALIVLVSIATSLVLHPLSLLLALALTAAWASLHFTRVEPLQVMGFEVGDRAVLAMLVVASVVVFVVGFGGGVWWNVVVAIGVGALACGVHSLLRSTDDLVGDVGGFGGAAASYEELLSDVEEGPNPRGEFEL